MRRAYLIDASIYIFRAYFSLPERWHARNGFTTHALRGYASFLLDLLEREQPLRVLAAFDESLGGCFRNEIHPGYKNRRVLPDAPLAFQLEACREFTRLLGIGCVASKRYEADDLLAAAAVQARALGLSSVVLSRDKDLGQLLQTDGDLLWDFPGGEPLGHEAYRARHGIRPAQVPDLLALTGDAIDDIPGVPGIGIKTATALLQDYPDIEAILGATGEIAGSGRRGAARTAAALEAHAAQIRMAHRLTCLCGELAGEAALPAFERQAPEVPALVAFVEEHGLDAGFRTRVQGVGAGWQ